MILYYTIPKTIVRYRKYLRNKTHNFSFINIGIIITAVSYGVFYGYTNIDKLLDVDFSPLPISEELVPVKLENNVEEIKLSVISYTAPILREADPIKAMFREVDKELKSVYKIGDEIIIEYSISDKGDNFKSPNFNGLKVLSGPNPSTQSSYSFVNGENQNSSSTTYSFYVKAEKEGAYRISPASVTVKGKRIASEEIQLNVIAYSSDSRDSITFIDSVTAVNNIINNPNISIKNKYRLGKFTTLSKNNIVFQFKKPMQPLKQSAEGSLINGKNDDLLVSFISPSVHLNIFSTPIPLKMQQEATDLFNSKQKIKSFINSIAPSPLHNVLGFKLVVINGRKFLEVKSVTPTLKTKKINWITFYKNNMISISCTSSIKEFEETLPFIIDFNNSIKFDPFG